MPDILKLIAALAFVVALMGGLALVLKKLGLNGASAPTGKKRRLAVVESLALDSRRRLVLLRRDKKEHLVILSVNGDTVIETGIEDALPEQPADDAPKTSIRASRAPTL
ncbi:MAG: flagellar biosynthetic protein FliO [Alphaproteobacteria bacterium]|nr:flagellar biosynthetic protein FliO [Alphaproteobacteria bacterium]